MKQKLNKLSRKISTYIVDWLNERDDFNLRTFYAETFSLYLLFRNDQLNQGIKLKLISSYHKMMQKDDPEFHWEFNNYALLNYYIESNDNEVEQYIKQLKFKNTKCSNWTLLRSNVKLLANIDVKKAHQEALYIINKFQDKNGFIYDEKRVKSFQYHCFSIAMIFELYKISGKKKYLNSFLKGVSFIRNFILPNGDTLYIGRGQQQIFGYSALLYILAAAYKMLKDDTIIADMESVYDFIVNNRKKDNLPLVLNGIDNGMPENVNMKDEQFLGWYPYNNYFDYISFMGSFIVKAEDLLKEMEIPLSGKIRKQKPYKDRNFIKTIREGYISIISKPGGYLTNDLPIPYVYDFDKNMAITPCYGGEEFQDSLYSKYGIPLPANKKLDISIRDYSFSFFYKNSLYLISLFGLMKRKFVFNQDSIIILTNVISVIPLNNIYLFKNMMLKQNGKIIDSNFEIISNKTLKYDGNEYSVNGKLFKYTTEKNNMLKFILL